MLLTPQLGDMKTITNMSIVGTATPGTGVPPGGTTLTYGTVTELISAANNTQDSWLVEVLVIDNGGSAVANQSTLDILIGGATDDVLIPSIICGSTFAATAHSYMFPVHVPRGVRIAARLASLSTTITPRVIIKLHGGGTPPFRVGSQIVALGTKIDNARGQAVTPTASGGAASVTQMIASTTEDYFYFYPGFQCSTDTTVNDRNINIGIGVGAATEERIGTWLWLSDAGEHQRIYPDWGVFRDIPAGQRLSLLASNSGTNDAAYDGLIYAVA